LLAHPCIMEGVKCEDGYEGHLRAAEYRPNQSTNVTKNKTLYYYLIFFDTKQSWAIM